MEIDWQHAALVGALPPTRTLCGRAAPPVTVVSGAWFPAEAEAPHLRHAVKRDFAASLANSGLTRSALVHCVSDNYSEADALDDYSQTSASAPSSSDGDDDGYGFFVFHDADAPSGISDAHFPAFFRRRLVSSDLHSKKRLKTPFSTETLRRRAATG
ncbi:hypothetical protein M885DRAFT_505744 [Pelagophyceae sp. CCMP2097]|nr:hypothetical protein M885DRAFT_505744 [Pelagophyceae sp. CCMP2097]